MNWILDHLPPGWTFERIEELCTLNPKHDKEIFDDLEISFIPMATVDEKTGTIPADTEYKLLGKVRRGYTHFADGDVIFAKITPCMENGKSAVAQNLRNGLACGSTEFYVLRSNGGIFSHYLHNFLRQDSFRQKAVGEMTGVVGHRRVPKEFILDTKIPLPSLNEQKRIVAKIEALQARSQSVKEELEAIRPLLDKFRQSVLSAAFRGDLTADWREKNPDVEPAEVLLERIRAERRRRWEEAELAKMKAKGNTPKDDKWKEKYEEPEFVNSDSLPELPNSWSYSFIEILLSKTRVGLKTGPFGTLLNKKEYRKQGIPIVGIDNISSTGFIDYFKDYVDRSKARELVSYALEAGDIIISRSGTVGEICIVPLEIGEAIISTNLIRVSLDKNCILPNIFCFLFRGSTFILNQVTNLCAGSTRDFLNQKILNSLIFPIPPLEEQKEIVRRVESLFKIADTIEQQYQQAEADLKTLNQSILAKAFQGELVPQDPNDEPASVLLERIRRERARQGRSKKGQSRNEKQKALEGNQLNLPGIEA